MSRLEHVKPFFFVAMKPLRYSMASSMGVSGSSFRLVDSCRVEEGKMIALALGLRSPISLRKGLRTDLHDDCRRVGKTKTCLVLDGWLVSIRLWLHHPTATFEACGTLLAMRCLVWPGQESAKPARAKRGAGSYWPREYSDRCPRPDPGVSIQRHGNR